MLAVQLENRDLIDVSSETDETRRIRFDFPISSLDGAASTAIVYFELEPGEHTGMHTDSAEELVLVLSGRVEAIVESQLDEHGLTPESATMYLCGNPEMITAVEEIAAGRGFPAEQVRKELYWPKGREHR